MRLFVAVFPPDDVCRDLRHRLTDGGARNVRLTPVDRWHVTLAFLGEVTAERLPEVTRELDAVTVPRGAMLRLHGGGRFGQGRSAVLWAGVEGDLDGLHRDVAGRLGVADREFTPHLTVAYRDDPVVRLALDGYAGPAWPLDGIALVRSVPGEGYTILRSW
ncbi:RNA 2',3'-cyclic phosphodiesterase [Amorphoplanes nipponensis]|uniref:RNA 2',3'-cyclic phosphodiesterase n=1 Tax=Actinoplanes nipponensis TaxID=135950 RepID=A0A919JJT5_9ACTN|nr:RNA 2',3'-cyclic phosphodiesterase [Actinoplanes nipponensis]GIE51866.1 RNA 2',3'-cyclic phosphodiesterase [Actinoplanes nipponensis]